MEIRNIINDNLDEKLDWIYAQVQRGYLSPTNANAQISRIFNSIEQNQGISIVESQNYYWQITNLLSRKR